MLQDSACKHLLYYSRLVNGMFCVENESVAIKNLKAYLEALDASHVKKAYVFSTSWLSKHALDLIKNALEAKGIEVAVETFYVKNRANDAQLAAAREFGKKD